MSRDTSIAREFIVSGFFLPIVVSYNIADDPDRHRDRGRFIEENTLRKSRFLKNYKRGQRKIIANVKKIMSQSVHALMISTLVQM